MLWSCCAAPGTLTTLIDNICCGRAALSRAHNLCTVPCTAIGIACFYCPHSRAKHINWCHFNPIESNSKQKFSTLIELKALKLHCITVRRHRKRHMNPCVCVCVRKMLHSQSGSECVSTVSLQIILIFIRLFLFHHQCRHHFGSFVSQTLPLTRSLFSSLVNAMRSN